MTGLLPETPQTKIDIMFEGVRYTPALSEAMRFAAPNFYPYRFVDGEYDPTGTGKAVVPYLLTFDDGTLVRLKGNGASPWHIEQDGEGYVLCRDGEQIRPVSFDPKVPWGDQTTGDGTPMTATGVDAHGDMLVVNVAPGCQYFREKSDDGKNNKCTFCGYGRPDGRMAPLGQQIDRVALADWTYKRLQDTLSSAMESGTIRHVYLVGGSMVDWRQEGERFLTLARAVREVVGHRAYVALGSGALPVDQLEVFAAEDLIDGACFNLEVWSEPLFASVCPGKERFVGWQRWLDSLYAASNLFGPDNTFTAMVGGVELEPEHGALSVEDAVDNAMQGANTLLDRGVTPIWSLYWPLWGADHPERLAVLRDYYERLNAEYADLRARRGVQVNTGFMCHRCAYMQLECDMDLAR